MGQANNILGIMPTPDKDVILAALPVLFQPDDVVELRAFHRGGKKRTDAGYFDSAHWPDLADHAARLSVAGAAVYVTLNPVDPQLLSRYCNRIEAWAAATTTDKQTVRRRWLLIDLDPARPAHTSATDRQVEAARCKAHEISAHLEGMGWPSPAAAESGNGCHLLYAIDLPNNDETSALVKAALGALGELFDDAVIKVDRQVFNAARICKLYGTVANKGDHTLPAPWRLSKMTAAPVRALVTAQQLRALVPQLTTAAPTRMSLSQPGAFNLEDFLARHGLDYTHDMHDGSNRFKLAMCPFNPEHGKGEAAVFRQPSGALGFKCQHDSCGSKGWRDVRNLLDGQRLTYSAVHPAADFLAKLPTGQAPTLSNAAAVAYPAGAVDPETGEIMRAPQVVQQASGFAFVSAGDLLRNPQPATFLVDDLIEHPSLALLFAPSGAGKSFLAIAWSASVATGTPWIGRDTQQGAVFYLAGEGHSGIARRLKAWELHSGVSLGSAPLFVSKVPASLMDASSAEAVTQAIEAMVALHGAPALIVIDTFARNMGDGDENKNSDIGVFVNRIDLMRYRLGVTVLLVHHSGHTEQDRARGGSGLNAAMDASFQLGATASAIVLTHRKSKESELCEPLKFELEQVQLPGWLDAKGREMKSAVLVASTAPPAPRAARLTDTQRAGMQAFYLAAVEHGTYEDGSILVGVPLAEWRREFYRTCTAGDQDAKKKAFQRVRSDLVKMGHLQAEDDSYLCPLLDGGLITARLLAGHATGTRDTGGTRRDKCPGSQPT